MMEGIFMKKNTLIIVIIAVLCLIPTVVAIANFKSTKDAPVDMSTATRITLDDIGGRTYTFDKASADTDKAGQADALINFFMQTEKNATQITGLPDSLLGERFYKVTMSNSAREESYEYYFSSDPSTCYYRAQNGNTFKIAESDAELFLSTAYAESVFSDSRLPTLTVSGTQTVTPDSAVWQFRNNSGSFVDADTSDKIKAETETFDLAGGLDLTFDSEPDYCHITVNGESGEKLWDGMLNEISTISLDKTKAVNIAIDARWYEDSSRGFCGHIGYNFSTTLTAPASFYIGMDTVGAGNFIAVTATNVLKPSAVELTSDMPKTIAPVFYPAENNMAVALLPIDTETPSGTYTLTFRYGGSSEDIALNVENGGSRSCGLIISESVLSTNRSDDALNEFASVANELMAKGSETRHFDGYFLEGVDSPCTIIRGFGLEVHVNNSSTPLYRNNGVDYSAVAGTSILAANDGEVVYVGMLDYSGYTVVIEHGYGLKTWYYNLGDTSVEVGAEVKRGDKIGEAGATGFTSGSGAHVAMSVGSTFVRPYDTWADSDIAGKVIIPKIDE